MKDVAVNISGLWKKYGDFPALSGIDLKVFKGEFFGLIGPNGAGKSTTIKILTGLLFPTKGNVTVSGFDIREDSVGVKGCIGLLPEDLNLYERLTGNEFVQFAVRMYGLPEDMVRERSQELFALLDLEEAKHRLIMEYSFGMKKKVALAAALIHEPKVLFLDEPFNGIDALTMRSVKNVLLELTGRGMTIFFSSHIMEVVEKLCDRIAIIDKGTIVAMGTVAELVGKVSIDWKGDGEVTLEDVFLHHIEGEEKIRRLSWIS
jgi:ABC-2 type transport system ATP-binding protein